MSKSIAISIQVEKEVLPSLEDSHFVYIQKLLGLTPRERQVFSTISVSAVGVIVTDINTEERQELIRLFKSLALSLENHVI